MGNNTSSNNTSSNNSNKSEFENFYNVLDYISTYYILTMTIIMT